MAALQQIRSGIEVVQDFVDSLGRNQTLDPDVVNAIQDLQRQSKLSKTRLLQALADKRKGVA